MNEENKYLISTNEIYLDLDDANVIVHEECCYVDSNRRYAFSEDEAQALIIYRGENVKKVTIQNDFERDLIIDLPEGINEIIVDSYDKNYCIVNLPSTIERVFFNNDSKFLICIIPNNDNLIKLMKDNKLHYIIRNIKEENSVDDHIENIKLCEVEGKPYIMISNWLSNYVKINATSIRFYSMNEFATLILRIHDVVRNRYIISQIANNRSVYSSIDITTLPIGYYFYEPCLQLDTTNIIGLLFNVKYIRIGNDVKSLLVDDNAVYNRCEYIYIDEGNENLIVDSNHSYVYSNDALIVATRGATRIHEGIGVIEAYSFSHLWLKKLVLPKSLKEIASGAFYETNIKELYFNSKSCKVHEGNKCNITKVFAGYTIPLELKRLGLLSKALPNLYYLVERKMFDNGLINEYKELLDDKDILNEALANPDTIKFYAKYVPIDKKLINKFKKKCKEYKLDEFIPYIEKIKNN